jgi:DNA primase
VEAVRERARIEDLFAAAALKRCGSGYVTTCPWHDDRRPSLSVSPQINRVHCFVCNRGADPIGWLQDRQGLSFTEAVQELAGRYGIPLPAQDPEAAARAAAEQQECERLRQWRSGLQEQFHQALQADVRRQGPAAAYLRQRGISPETANAWGLGLHGQRLMLPIRDGQGHCCGFSGRAIGDLEPKYRNSAGDALFQKSRLLFGLDRAAGTIRRTGEALLVEGPLDVIQLHQGGIENTVAAMGTSLTPEQRQNLQRCGARRLLVAFDGDEAGLKATGRTIAELRPMAIGGVLELAVMELPAGSDPDGLMRSHGEEAFRGRIQRAKHWLDWELEQVLAPLQLAPDDLAVLQRCEQQASLLLAALPPGALRHRAEQRLKEGLGALPAGALSATAGQGTKDTNRSQVVLAGSGGIRDAAGTDAREGQAQEASASERAEWRALRLFVCSPQSRELIGSLQLRHPRHRQALACLQQVQRRLPAGGDTLQADALPAAVLALCPRLEPHLAHLLEQLCQPGREVQQLLATDPGPELMVVLDVLEPVGRGPAIPP